MRRASRRVYAGVQILCVAARARFPVRFPDGTTMIGGRAGRRVVAGVPGAVAGAIAAAPWPLVVAVAAYLRAMMAPRALLNDPDTYLHIAAGQWFVAHRGLPAGDPFSFTAAGAPWLPGEWLGEVILAAAYGLGGWSAVVVLTALCCAAAFGLLARCLARRLDGLAAAVASLAGLALVQPHLVARPPVLALPLLVAWCGALVAARDAGRGPPWRLLAAMPLWANLHASFLFGIALAGFLAGEAVLHPGAGRTRTREAGDWALFVAAAALLALLTPNGVGGVVQPFRLMAMPALQTSFGEWLPADFRAFPALALWLAGLVALCLWCGVRVPGTRLALLLLLVHMALSHVRHADLLGLVAPLALASAFAPTGRPAAPVSAAAVAAGLAVALAATLPLAARLLVRGADPVADALRYPVDVADPRGRRGGGDGPAAGLAPGLCRPLRGGSPARPLTGHADTASCIEGRKTHNFADADRQRHPQRVSRLLRRGRPRGRAVEPAGAAQRPDPAVHQCRDGPVQERVYRGREARRAARRHLAEVRARRRQAQRPRKRRVHRAAPHVFRDARQFLVRRLFQGPGDRTGVAADHQGVRAVAVAAAGDRLCRGRRSRRVVVENRRPAGPAHHPHRDLGQFLVDGRYRAVRPVLGDFLRSWRGHSRRSAGQPRRRRRPLRRDLEPRLHAIRAEGGGRARAVAEPVDRHRLGARTHRRGVAGQARQLRHRPVPRADPCLGRRLGGGRRWRACRLAPGDRRPPARQRLSDRRRRAAEQGGARLRAAPDHAPGDAPCPDDRLQGAADVAAGAGPGPADGRRLSRAAARAGADHRDPALRGRQFPPDARARAAPAGRGAGQARPRRRLSRRGGLPALRHLRLPARPDRGCPARPRPQGCACRVRGGDGTAAPGGAAQLGRFRRGRGRGERV